MSHQRSYTSDLHRPPALPPLHRQRAPQPPTLLTTSLSNSAYGHGHGLPLPASHGHTPASAVSLSAPFSLHGGAQYPASPAASAASPMALRSAGPAAPYNPQQWARHDGSSPGPSTGLSPMHAHYPPRTQVYAPRLRGPDEPMVSPPPPYTAEATSPSPADTRSPETDFSYGTVPSSASAVSPADMMVPIGLETRSPIIGNNSPASPNVSNIVYPPPPPMSGRNRSASRNPADRLLSAMNIRSRGAHLAAAPTAIETLHQTTSHLLHTADPNGGMPAAPPASRRAASAGAIGTSYPPRSPYASSPAQDLGITLPPPPPGPPPAPARSQSECRAIDVPSAGGPGAARSFTSPVLRQRAARASDLGPVPPTPADWVDEDDTAAGRAYPRSADQQNPPAEHTQHWQRPLHVQTSNLVQEQLTESPMTTEMAGSAAPLERVRRDSGGLVRSPAVRNRSAQGLRERRSESKRRVESGSGSGDSAGAEGSSGDALARPLKDIVIASEQPSHRRSSTQTPRTGGSFQGLDEALRSGGGKQPQRPGHESSARSTPRADAPRTGGMPSSQSTPPLSPFSAPRSGTDSPLAHRSSTRARLSVGSSSSQRPISHLLHMPNDESVRTMPLSPESNHSLMDFDPPESPKAFSDRAMQRHRQFALKEANAASDSERLHLFTQFMVAESRIRREKYGHVFDEEQVDAADLLKGMFEEMGQQKPSLVVTDRDSANESRRSSGTSFVDSRSHSRPGSSNATEPLQLTLDTSVADPRAKSFVPALSPIASMSAVTGRDEMDSRGRAPSRWWESQSNSSNKGDGFDVLKRTKRESKYMSAVLEDEQLPSFEDTLTGGASSSQQFFGENEYPPEKVGWHEPASSASQQAYQPPTPHSAPFTPDPRRLDISRLITLPPPYPRHYPADNNSHPDLADVRNTVRTLQDMAEVDEKLESFKVMVQGKRERANSWCDHRKSMHDQDIQFRIERGEITQQQYDNAEVELEESLLKSKVDLATSIFQQYQETVMKPLHPLLTDRIGRTEAAFSAFTMRLNSDAETHSPNLPQEAGDERPELAEKLTMLKWLADTRELLHRKRIAMLSDRSDYYKDTVTAPYTLSRRDKVDEAEAFFAQDARAEKANAGKAARKRAGEFLAAIEMHVTKGVEVQLSAFWDIAPPLQALLQRIPDAAGLAGFEILVPKGEVDENPAYWAHPLRYLYSVLAHADASSHQFVDGQVRLWCLLQEAREGFVRACWAEREAECRRESRGADGLAAADQGRMARQLQQGEDDLKERVGAVEGQWVEGLGGEIGRVREAAREWLETSGGWDDELESGE